MNRDARLSRILDLLAEHRQVTVETVVSTLDVSPATARRDLDSLAEQQLLTRTRGGAVAHAAAYDLPLRYRHQHHSEEKLAIARTATKKVQRGSVIGLCGGTTTSAIAEALMVRPDLIEPSDAPNLTVVTIGVNIAAQLATRPQIRTVITGGVVNPRSYEAIGPYAEAVLGNIALDLVFIGADGLDAVHGATSQDEREASVTKLMMSRAAETILVVDSSKFDRRAFAAMGGPEKFASVITDRDISADQLKRFTEAGYRIEIAS